jgi:hypothetical protein
MLGSKYAPNQKSQYSAKDMNTNFQGKRFEPVAGEASNHDFLVTDDMILDGARVYVNGASDGDYIGAQVVDVDNILGYGAGFVLQTFVDKWFLSPAVTLQFDHNSDYPAKIYGGLYIRIIYHSVGETAPAAMLVNFKLHKVLW